MYSVTVMFNPMSCVSTPVHSDSGHPWPSYERSFIGATSANRAGDRSSTDGMLSTGIVGVGQTRAECSNISFQQPTDNDRGPAATKLNNWIQHQQDNIEQSNVNICSSPTPITKDQDIMNNVRDEEELDLHQENFYNKLMALKKEHERHIKLVEKVYFSGVTKESHPYYEENSVSAKHFTMPYFKEDSWDVPSELWYFPDNDVDAGDDEVRAFSRSNSSVSLPTCSDTDDEHTVKTVRRTNSQRFLNRQTNVGKSPNVANQIQGNLEAVSNNTESNLKSGKENKRIHNKLQPPAKKFPTVPEPFEMTIREEEKLRERIHALKLLDDNSNIMQPKQSPNFEHFKAIEMPSHVRENRYEKMIRRQEKRRLKAKEEASRELMKKLQPFTFVEREERKNILRRSDSVPNMKTSCNQKENIFQANPFPEHLFTSYAYEQQKEKENYREIQKKLRQELLLKKSYLPPRMEAEFLKKKMQENKGISKSKQTSQSFPRKVKKDGKLAACDLDRLYREYKENLERKTQQRDLSMDIERAKLHERGLSKKSKQRPMSADSVQRRPFSQFDLHHSNEGDLEKCFNLTTQMRMKLIERRQIKKAERDLLVEREERQREERARRRRMNNPVWDNIRHDLDSQSLAELTQRRLEEERIREKNYKLELEQMMRRVENQPTLFQKQSQACAKKSIEKKYAEVLKRQGVDAEEIENIWKLLPRTHENRKQIGLQNNSSHSYDDYNPPDQLEDREEFNVDNDADDIYSEPDLAESISINLSPIKDLHD